MIDESWFRWGFHDHAHGIPSLRTFTEHRLAGMLDLNRRLGHVPLYDEIALCSRL